MFRAAKLQEIPQIHQDASLAEDQSTLSRNLDQVESPKKVLQTLKLITDRCYCEQLAGDAVRSCRSRAWCRFICIVEALDFVSLNLNMPLCGTRKFLYLNEK